jgi:arginine N-succinyltransferase
MEGFAYDGYVDIFDAGPTLSVRTDAIHTISQSRLIDEDRILRTSETERPISAMGTGADFRCWQGGASDDPLGPASA